jgi:3-phosphoshikimate 1-carboxyvinyltransferase
MAPLLNTLKDLGCNINFSEKEGFFPFTLEGKGFTKEKISINIEHSSQFLSGLLMASPLSENPVEIQIEGSHGLSYIEMTGQMMEQFGIKVEKSPKGAYLIEKNQSYHPLTYQIEPDVSAACYFYALAPLLGIQVLVKDVYFNSLQGDIEFLKILEKMGCTLKETPQGITISGKKDMLYKGITVDMSACSDQAITLAALAPFATTPTTITGIAHIRHQESDRLQAIATELERMGIACEQHPDSLTIHPASPKPALIHTYEDHRMAMGFSLIGLRAKGIVIDNPLCCKKTFENYFEVMESVVEQLLKKD